MKKIWKYSIVALGLVLLTGCGVATTAPSTSKTQNNTQSNPPTAVSNANSQNSTPPVQKKVPLASLQKRLALALNPPLYKSLLVKNANGQSVTLDVEKTPLVFISTWSSQVIMQQFASDNVSSFSNKPVLISTAPIALPHNKMPSFSSFVKQTEQFLQQNNATGYQVYYLESDKVFGKLISGLPDTYVYQKGYVYHIPGILPSASNWTQVFEGTLSITK